MFARAGIMTAASVEQARERSILAAELQETWPVLSAEERLEGLRVLPHAEAEDFLLALPARDQAEIILQMSPGDRRSWMRLLPPDDAADVIQESPEEEREGLLAVLDEPTRKEVAALLAYKEDEAGGLMNPRYARLRPDMSVDEAITYLRRQARERLETINYVYVLDTEQRLLGVITFRELFAAAPDKTVRDIMHTDVVTAHESMDQEALSRLFAEHNFLAIPVLDDERHVKGIVTVDDIVDVVQEEATEDIQKFGGMEALDAPYLEIGFWSMVRKRGGWLSALFQNEISRAVILALFVPLIISSGGNSGSQASTLVVRALALGELRLRDWWRVIRREVAAGLALGGILAGLGFSRILLWQTIFHGMYGQHYLLIAFTVASSLLGVVTWGTLAGSMLPLLLRRLGFDPASASAPFVATLVDVSGIVIYFSVASVILGGTLL